MVHTRSSAFGPGLTRAYQLENGLAKMPRVIVDQECEREKFEHGDNLDFCQKHRILFRDTDGYLVVDYLRERFLAARAPWEDERMPLSHVRDYIAEYSRHYSNIEAVKVKTDWVIAHFNGLVDELQPIGVDRIGT